MQEASMLSLRVAWARILYMHANRRQVQCSTVCCHLMLASNTQGSRRLLPAHLPGVPAARSSPSALPFAPRLQRARRSPPLAELQAAPCTVANLPLTHESPHPSFPPRLCLRPPEWPHTQQVAECNRDLAQLNIDVGVCLTLPRCIMTSVSLRKDTCVCSSTNSSDAACRADSSPCLCSNIDERPAFSCNFSSNKHASLSTQMLVNLSANCQAERQLGMSPDMLIVKHVTGTLHKHVVPLFSRPRR